MGQIKNIKLHIVTDIKCVTIRINQCVCDINFKMLKCVSCFPKRRRDGKSSKKGKEPSENGHAPKPVPVKTTDPVAVDDNKENNNNNDNNVTNNNLKNNNTTPTKPVTQNGHAVKDTF